LRGETLQKDATMTVANDQSSPKTISVPAAGKQYFGLAKNAAYAAAARGEIPVIRIGGRLRVPVIQLERLLRGDKLGDAPR
jgi:hypothetical protein